MTAIGKGDWLECVRGDTCNCGGGHISPPNVYRCAEVIPPPFPYDHWLCLHCGQRSALALVVDGQEDHCYCACCFKPGGYRPNEEVLAAIAAKPLVHA